jgi:hypothetical protein
VDGCDSAWRRIPSSRLVGQSRPVAFARDGISTSPLPTSKRHAVPRLAHPLRYGHAQRLDSAGLERAGEPFVDPFIKLDRPSIRARDPAIGPAGTRMKVTNQARPPLKKCQSRIIFIG